MPLGRLILHPIGADLEEEDLQEPPVPVDEEDFLEAQERREMQRQLDFSLAVSAAQLEVHIEVPGLVAVRLLSLHPPDPIKAPFMAAIAKVFDFTVYVCFYFKYVTLEFDRY